MCTRNGITPFAHHNKEETKACWEALQGSNSRSGGLEVWRRYICELKKCYTQLHRLVSCERQCPIAVFPLPPPPSCDLTASSPRRPCSPYPHVLVSNTTKVSPPACPPRLTFLQSDLHQYHDKMAVYSPRPPTAKLQTHYEFPVPCSRQYTLPGLLLSLTQ